MRLVKIRLFFILSLAWTTFAWASSNSGVLLEGGICDECSLPIVQPPSSKMTIKNIKEIREHSLDGCNKNWIQLCGALVHELPEASLSDCDADPASVHMSLKTTQCMEGITEAINISVAAPAYIALAAVHFVESVNTTCKGYSKEFFDEVNKFKKMMDREEVGYMRQLYGTIASNTWESLSCDQVSQISFCQSYSQVGFCSSALNLQNQSEKNFSQSIFSNSEKSNSKFQLIVKPEQMSRGIIKTRLNQCSDFRKKQKGFISNQREYLKDFRNLIKDDSCRGAFDSISNEIYALASARYSEYQVYKSPPSGCYSDEYLSQKYCAIAADIAMIVGPFVVSKAPRIVGAASKHLLRNTKINSIVPAVRAKVLREPAAWRKVSDEQLLQTYPKVEQSNQKIDKVFADNDPWLSQGKESAYDRIDSYTKDVNPKEREAIRSVVDALHDNKAWVQYTKDLNSESAKWILSNGGLAEKQMLKEHGKISRRSMLAVLARRAIDRGEALGKIKTTNENKFFEQVRKGPFIDQGISYAPQHGAYAHLLQMDYVAPQLLKQYGNTKDFYEVITRSNNWNWIFDLNEFNMASPKGVTGVLEQVLPLN